MRPNLCVLGVFLRDCTLGDLSDITPAQQVPLFAFLCLAGRAWRQLCEVLRPPLQRPFGACPAEIRQLEVRPAEVRPGEVRPDERGVPEILPE